LEAAYSFSKSIDNASDERDNVLNPSNPSLSRALSSFDIKHIFVVSYNYLLPFDFFGKNRWPRLTQGWRLAGITRFSSGLPIQLYETDDHSFVGEFFGNMDVPIYNGGKLHFTNPRSNQPYFDPSLFSLEPMGVLNTSARRFFHGPGINNFDLSLLKDTRVTERVSVEFRAEFFNAFNHTQFNNPSGDINSNSFGVVNSARDPRIGQVALKMFF
jgi:hypothetical protein